VDTAWSHIGPFFSNNWPGCWVAEKEDDSDPPCLLVVSAPPPNAMPASSGFAAAEPNMPPPLQIWLKYPKSEKGICGDPWLNAPEEAGSVLEVSSLDEDPATSAEV
jgi:hypothetical protein